MKKIYIIIMVIGIVLLIIISYLLLNHSSVETREQAIQIAKEYVNKMYDNDFNEYIINVEFENDIWIVYYSKNIESEENSIIGGGGPSLEIRKSDGKVLSCLLQK